MLRVLFRFQSSKFAMNRLGAAILLHLVLVLFRVEAQSGSVPDFASQDDTNFQPSLGVVIGILSIMFMLTFFLLAYAKFCHRRESAVNLANQTGVISTSSRFSGIDKTVIESLPFFRFSSLKGSKEGLECAVCLSKFEDVEVLRLLPKCKHAFHIACIDHWLERHSSCPLCRHRVSSEDLAIITYSTSMRFLWNNQSEQREDSNIELFVQREDSHRGSSRFSVGSSFRKIEKGDKDQELLLQKEGSGENSDDQKTFHKHNHKIMVSDFVFKNRWSNVSSSDLIFLSSEMLNDMSSNRFSSLGTNVEHLACAKGEENEEIMKIKAEMEIKRSFEIKVGTINSSVSTPSLPSSIPSSSKSINHGEQRSMSEITAISRNGNWGLKNKLKDSSLFENNAKEERLRRLWLPIARRTVQWFANREKRSSSQQSQNELERPLEQV